MPQDELNLDYWVVDERTGYLVNPNNLRSITPAHKEAFLAAMLKLGNESEAAQSCGFSTRILAAHKRADKKFREDFQDTLLKMKHILEGVMFIRAQNANGYMDRITWLRHHYPKEYDPKFISPTKDNKKVIDDLWNSLNNKDNGKSK